MEGGDHHRGGDDDALKVVLELGDALDVEEQGLRADVRLDEGRGAGHEGEHGVGVDLLFVFVSTC